MLVVGASCAIPDVERPPSAPEIRRFEAVPFLVAPGESTQVVWAVTGALTGLELTLPGAPPRPLPAASGRLELIPSEETELLLTASGPGGTTEARALIRLGRLEPVSVDAFSVTPTLARASEPLRVEWATRAATRIALLANEREIAADLAPMGARVVRLETTTQLRLRAEGLGGPVTEEIRVLVGAPPPIIYRFFAAPAEVEPGSPATLTWAVQDARELRIFELVEPRPVLLRVEVPALDEGGATLTRPPGVHRFRLEVTGDTPADTRTAETSLSVVRAPRPVIERFSVTPTVTGAGGEARLAWSVRDAASVTLREGSRVEPVAPVGARLAQMGTESLSVELSASGGGEVEARRLTLHHDPARPRIERLVAAPSPSASGEPVRIEWATERAAGVELSDDLGRLLASGPPTGALDLIPDGPWTLVLTARSPEGATSRSLPLETGPRPRIERFEPLDGEVRLGRPGRFTFATVGSRDRSISAPGRAPVALETERGTIELRLDRPEAATLRAKTEHFAVSATAAPGFLPSALGETEEEPNDASPTANVPPGPPSRFAGTLRPGERDIIVLEHPRGLRLRLRAQCGPGLALVAHPLNASGGLLPRSVRVDPLPCGGPTIERELARLGPGMALALEPAGAASAGVETPYALEYDTRVPACGDGVVDRDEACDDGNLAPRDGCDGRCELEGLDELEVNDSAPSATPVLPGSRRAFLHEADEDWFFLTVGGSAPPGAWFFLVTDVGAAGCSVDATLALFDASGRALQVDDGGGLGCPSLRGPATVLAPGTWYLRVTPGDGARLEPRGLYELTIGGPP